MVKSECKKKKKIFWEILKDLKQSRDVIKPDKMSSRIFYAKNMLTSHDDLPSRKLYLLLLDLSVNLCIFALKTIEILAF